MAEDERIVTHDGIKTVKKGAEVWDGKPLMSARCLNCGCVFRGTIGGLSGRAPICLECRETRYKPRKRGKHAGKRS